MAYRVDKVANTFLHIAREESDAIDPMKMQKLIYLAHGLHLALYEEPLVTSPIRAWRYGPVIKPLYDKTKRYGSNPITRELVSEIVLDEDDKDTPISEETLALLREVWRAYGGDTALQLSSLTHDAEAPEGKPWHETWVTNNGHLLGNSVIPNDLIQNSFKKLLA